MPLVVLHTGEARTVSSIVSTLLRNGSVSNEVYDPVPDNTVSLVPAGVASRSLRNLDGGVETTATSGTATSPATSPPSASSPAPRSSSRACFTRIRPKTLKWLHGVSMGENDLTLAVAVQYRRTGGAGNIYGGPPSFVYFVDADEFSCTGSGGAWT